MLKDSRASATMPAKDLARARAFYEGKLGFQEDPNSDEVDGVIYACGGGTSVLVFESRGASSGDHTQLSLEVDDIEAEVRALRDKGVALENYDFPGLKTESGIAEMPNGRGGWFKDTEGNLIAVFQRARVPSRTS
jgi:catechol 2,3-dioxygenase-like lactoylglutathione lyase family enzyme